MKKFIKTCSLFCLATFMLVCITSCNNNKIDNYILTTIFIRNIDNNNEETIILETFNELYPDIIGFVGKTIKIKNENEIIFSGNKTKNYNGTIEYYNAGFITYITINNDDFYVDYENISIMTNLYIEGRIINIDGQNLKLTFQYEKN